MNGEEILQAIRDDYSLFDTPVIVCTVDTQFLRERAESLRERNCDWLEKPFELDTLLGKIDLAIRRSEPQHGDRIDLREAGN